MYLVTSSFNVINNNKFPKFITIPNVARSGHAIYIFTDEPPASPGSDEVMKNMWLNLMK